MGFAMQAVGVVLLMAAGVAIGLGVRRWGEPGGPSLVALGVTILGGEAGAWLGLRGGPPKAQLAYAQAGARLIAMDEYQAALEVTVVLGLAAAAGTLLMVFLRDFRKSEGAAVRGGRDIALLPVLFLAALAVGGREWAAAQCVAWPK